MPGIISNILYSFEEMSDSESYDPKLEQYDSSEENHVTWDFSDTDSGLGNEVEAPRLTNKRKRDWGGEEGSDEEKVLKMARIQIPDEEDEKVEEPIDIRKAQEIPIKTEWKRVPGLSPLKRTWSFYSKEDPWEEFSSVISAERNSFHPIVPMPIVDDKMDLEQIVEKWIPTSFSIHDTPPDEDVEMVEKHKHDEGCLCVKKKTWVNESDQKSPLKQYNPKKWKFQNGTFDRTIK